MFYIVHLLSFIFLSHSFLQGPTLKRFQRHYNLEQYALPTNIVFKILDTIQYTTQDEWNSLLTPETSPFLNYEWICALEKSGCAVAEQGSYTRVFLLTISIYYGVRMATIAFDVLLQRDIRD
jgi:hypothetical protein